MTDTSKSALTALRRLQEEARQQGIDELGRAVLEALTKAGFRLPTTAGAPAEGGTNGAKPKRRRSARLAGVRPGTDMAAVLDTVKKHPGNKGHQIQALLAMSGRVVNERTMRTALHRLKGKQLIEQRDGAWHPKEETRE